MSISKLRKTALLQLHIVFQILDSPVRRARSVALLYCPLVVEQMQHTSELPGSCISRSCHQVKDLWCSAIMWMCGEVSSQMSRHLPCPSPNISQRIFDPPRLMYKRMSQMCFPQQQQQQQQNTLQACNAGAKGDGSSSGTLCSEAKAWSTTQYQ